MRYFNAEQKAYMQAKAILATLQDEENALDEKYIKENNITNPDGTMPTRTYAIEDDSTAEKAIHEVGKLLADSGLWGDILKARELLKETENALISYGLEIAPASTRETLSSASKTNYTVRDKMINAIMLLDTRTVK